MSRDHLSRARMFRAVAEPSKQAFVVCTDYRRDFGAGRPEFLVADALFGLRPCLVMFATAHLARAPGEACFLRVYMVAFQEGLHPTGQN